MEEERKQGPLRRLTQLRRETFLEVLAQTGNRRMAAEAIGFEPRLMDQRRRYDRLLDRQWTEALRQADRRLAGIDGPFDQERDAMPAVVVKRGRGGRLMLQRAGEKRWSRAVEDRFFATLAMCGNIAASARAVGFSKSCVDQRRRKWPDFGRRLEETLDDAEIEIEFRVAAEVQGKRGGGDGQPAMEPGPLDLDSAMRFLKWRQEKKAGRGRRGRLPAPPSIESSDREDRQKGGGDQKASGSGRGATLFSLGEKGLWRVTVTVTFLDEGLDPDDRADLRIAERRGRLLPDGDGEDSD